MVNKRKIQQLINLNEFNEALVIINNLENTSDIDFKNHLVCRFLKSQVLAKTGKSEEGLELADKTLTVVRNQDPSNQLLLVDAIITKIVALRWARRFFSTYSIKNLSGYLQLLEEGERILENISNIEPLERTERTVILQRNKGHIYSSLREFDQAEKYFQESVVLHKKMGNINGIIEVMVDLATIFEVRTKYDRQLEIFQKCLNLCEELEDREGIAEHLQNLASVYQSKGEPETASIYVQRSLQLANELPGTIRIAKLLYDIGMLYYFKRDETAASLDAFQKSLSVSEELDDKDGIQLSLHLLGDLHQYSKGDLNRALEFYKRSMKLFEEVGGNVRVHAWNLTDAGNLYHLKGDLNLALVHFQKAISLFEEISDDFYFCQTFLHIGRAYRSKGDNKTALDYYKRCLELLEEKKLRVGQETKGLTYYELIAVMLDNKDNSKAKKYFQQFNQYYEKQELSKQFLSQWYKLSEALILKTSIRIKDKARAQQLFQEIIDDEDLKLDLLNFLADPKKTAMLNLCELLLFELKSSPDEITDENEVFQEVKDLLGSLVSLAEQQHSFPLLVNTLILQARFSLVEGNLTGAMDFLNKGKTTADEKKLVKLSEKVSVEIEILINQLDTWEALIQENIPLKERLVRTRLEEYISKASKIVNIE
ncbi:MAG: tetratricopeptide repeat protein [Candidatus Hodarchaeales archaeon]|jgi:tetratricopeptide (TPR) repeat protein